MRSGSSADGSPKYAHRRRRPVVSRTCTLGEKLHAYTLSYRASGRRSTRPKDLVDILLIAASEPIDAKALRAALETTFSERQRHELPSSLPAPPADWAAPYSRLAIDVGVDAELMAAFTRAAAFLDPILAGRSAGTWDAARERWS
jgi:hypothetical protein